MITRNDLRQQFEIRGGLTQEQFEPIITKICLFQSEIAEPIQNEISSYREELNNLKIQKAQLALKEQEVGISVRTATRPFHAYDTLHFYTKSNSENY